MGDRHHLRVTRELFLAAFGAHLGRYESWVTDRFVSLLEEEEVRAGESLFSVDDTPEFFYFMREGGVQLLREGHRTWRLDGRHVFGIVDGLLDRSRTRTAVATTDLQLMKVRIEAWLELLDDSFELARASIFELARNVAQLEEKLDAIQGAGGRALARGPGTTAGHVPGVRLNVIERLAILMDVALLRSGGVQPLSDLAVASQELQFDPGAMLFDRRVPRDRVFVVVEGVVEASRADPDLVRTAGPGEIVCGAAAFGEPALAWKARATERGRALAFRIDDWFDLMEEHFDLVRSALAALSLQHEAVLDEVRH